MSPRHDNGPRAPNAEAVETVRGTGTTKITAPRPDDRGPHGRFVAAHPWTCIEVERALGTADAYQLIRALDLSTGKPDDKCHCPNCGALRSCVALGRWHWTCERCRCLGSWLALRQSVALSVEAMVRLAEAVLGRREVA